MRRMLAGVAMVAAVMGGPVPSLAHQDPLGAELGLAVGAAALNIFYVPTKLTFAGLGLVGGSLVGVLTGGDTRSAYALMVPTATGTFLVRPEHLSGEVPLEFVGADYADRPSTMPAAADAGSIYDAAYMMK